VCSRVLSSGTALQLTATPDPGSTFTGWSGGGCSGTGVCSVTLTTATTVTATFTAPPGQFALSVTRRGSASGTVTSAPQGIACGARCTQLYTSGTLVTLTANAGAGAVFKGWSGGGCSGSGRCVVTMTAMRSVRAIFSTAFTSPNPTPRVSAIQAADITDLRSAINTLRAQNFGLGGLTFTDPTIVIRRTAVKAVHITELRSALNEAYVQAGIAPPSYSAPALAPGATVIRAADVNELRSAVLALE
jgi:hypothetical protein